MTDERTQPSDSTLELNALEPQRETYSTPRLISYGKFQHVTLQVSDSGGTEDSTDPLV